MIKKLFSLFVIALLLSGVSMAFAENPEVTAADKDGLILYSLCSADAKLLMMSGDTESDTIKIAKDAKTTKFFFHEHTLSCGTHMNGVISESKIDGKLVISGDFDVTHNPYKITKLLININNDLKNKTVTGTLTIDGKEVDVNLLK